MKKLQLSFFIYLCLLITIQIKAQNNFNWSKPKYYQVKAYLYGIYTTNYQPIVLPEQQLNSTILDTNGVKLNPKQIQTLLEITQDTSSFKDNEAMCFIPHYGFVFWDEKQNPIAHISVCLMCEKILIYPKLNNFNLNQGIIRITQLIKDLNFPVFKHQNDIFKYWRETQDTTQYIFNEYDNSSILNSDTALSNLRKIMKFFGKNINRQKQTKYKMSFSLIVERSGEISDLQITSNFSSAKFIKKFKKYIISLGKLTPALFHNKYKVRYRFQRMVYLDKI